jgi:hypothetical protein
MLNRFSYQAFTNLVARIGATPKLISAVSFGLGMTNYRMNIVNVSGARGFSVAHIVLHHRTLANSLTTELIVHPFRVQGGGAR